MVGPGWACDQPAGPCTATDEIAAGETYPAISVKVNVSVSASAPFTNIASVQGGGDTNAANNTASDLTNITTTPACAVLPESPHPYPNGIDMTWTCGVAGATSVNVTFDSLTSVENGVDFIHITDGNGNPIAGSPFTGTSLAGQTKTVPGNTFKIRLVADGRRADYGFKVTNIAATQPGALDVGITKTHTGNFTQGQSGAAYVVTVKNTGGVATNAPVTVTDNLPAGLTLTSVSGPGWNCTQPAGPCVRTDSLAPGASYPSITFIVNVAANAPSTITNVARVSMPGDTTPNNDEAPDPTTIIPLGGPDLTITKTHTGNFSLGQVGAAYTVTVKNSGAGSTSGTVTVTDTIPSGLTATNIAGNGWSCTQPAGPCTRNDSLAAGASYPPITVTVTVASNAAASVTNTAAVSGGGDANTGNNSASDPTAIDSPGPACVLESAHPYAANTDLIWTCTVSDNPSALDVTFDPRTSLEPGIDFLYVFNANGVSVPGSPFTGTELAGQTKRVTGNTVVIRLVSDRRNNDFGFKVTSIVPVAGTIPDLRIVKTHVGNFLVNQFGATYTLAVDNAGSAPTNGMVTVTDTLPAGLTPVSIGGSGWSCTQPAGSCTRADVLAPGAAYPPLTLTVNVPGNAPASVTNTASVSGGGDGNPANNTATDPTTISPALTPDLTITKTHAGSFVQGQTGGAYTITVKNSGSATTSGVVTVTDLIPAGLTLTAINGSGWSCTVPSGSCTRSDALPAGSSYQPITVTVNVAANAPASVTNTAAVSGGGDTTPANNTAADPTTIGASASCPYPESPHPYPDNFDFTWTCALAANVTSIDVTFDAQTSVEAGIDFIYIMDGNNANIPGSPFTGAQLAGQTKRVPGSVLKIRLVTNRRNQDWGFKVTNIVGNTAAVLKN